MGYLLIPMPDHIRDSYLMRLASYYFPFHSPYMTTSNTAINTIPRLNLLDAYEPDAVPCNADRLLQCLVLPIRPLDA